MHRFARLDPDAAAFYRAAMRALLDAKVPFMVGGAYAFERYTHIARHSKDLDLFVRAEHRDPALATLGTLGCRTEVPFPHWLGKAWQGTEFVDIIYSSGNGIAVVDDVWFEHAPTSEVLGVKTLIIPAEEMIWSKAFIMERERFDGADIAHLLHSRAEDLDWSRLLERFGYRWRVLYAHVLLFGFIYPGHRDRIPREVMRELGRRVRDEVDGTATSDVPQLCQGTILSREQYLPDLSRGYQDARLRDDVQMDEDDIDVWTLGIEIDGAGAKL